MPLRPLMLAPAFYTYWLPVALALQFLGHRYVSDAVASRFCCNNEAAGAFVLLIWSILVLGGCLAGIAYARQKHKSLLGIIYVCLLVKDLLKIPLYLVVALNMNQMENHN